MKHSAKKANALITGILAGLSAPGMAFFLPSYPSLQGSDLERMRQSACRVGGDFQKIILRENGKAAGSKTAA